MPSPIAHTAAGYAIYRVFRRRHPKSESSRFVFLPKRLVLAGSLSLLPDLDFVPGLILGNIDLFHNNMAHSLIFGLLVSLMAALFMWFRQRSRFAYWFMLVLSCYELHVVMDYFTVGRGVMILWPFSSQRYLPAIKLFYGLHRSDGLVSIKHLWTLLTELGFALLVWLAINSLWPRLRTKEISMGWGLKKVNDR